MLNAELFIRVRSASNSSGEELSQARIIVLSFPFPVTHSLKIMAIKAQLNCIPWHSELIPFDC